MTPALSRRLQELREAAGEIEVLKDEPDHLIVLLLEADPEPVVVVIRDDIADATRH